MTRIPIVPAFIPKSASEVVEFTKQLNFSRELHLDVVDGIFVGTPSWPYQPIGEPLSVKSHTDAFTLEVDLMVKNPSAAAIDWVRAGADMLVFHIETIDLTTFISIGEQLRTVSLGISLHGDTPIESILPYLEYADYVQLMGIEVIGLQGQPFSEKTFEKISFIKSHYPQLPISVDGSVNEVTIKRLVDAGADRLIVGSAIVKKENPHDAYVQLCSLINES